MVTVFSENEFAYFPTPERKERKSCRMVNQKGITSFIFPLAPQGKSVFTLLVSYHGLTR